MAFTAEEQTLILRYLGYADWRQLAQSIQLGFPAESQHSFLVRDGFKRLTPAAEQNVRRDLCELQDIERQMSDARRRMKADQLGNLRINKNETRQLRRELEYWTTRLEDDFGVKRNPYSSMARGFGGTVNAKVTG